MKLNKKQKVGLADSLDKIGIAAWVGAIVGVFVEDKVTLVNAIILALIGIAAFIVAAILKSGEDEG